jgi:protein-tyrosine-phosphatase/predicted ATP-grasp superfamily ATP-dependent carboligase
MPVDNPAVSCIARDRHSYPESSVLVVHESGEALVRGRADLPSGANERQTRCDAEAARQPLVIGGQALVLGDDTRSFLAVVRSLGRRGVVVHAAPANFRSPALRSRYIAAIHELPPWMDDGAQWLAAMDGLLRSTRYDLVIPCNETALLPLRRHRDTLSRWTTFAIPDDRAIATLFDKHATRGLARAAGVPVAAGRLALAGDSAQAVLEEFGAPVVVKPRRSYSLDTLAARGNVQVVTAADRLADVLRACDPGETIIERFFPGRGVGVSLLASRGRVLQAFEHHRVREIAGASFYRVSARLTPDLAHACAAIVEVLDYTGLAMFEFKVDPEGGWILLEINARPWGSLPLPLALGIDFPYRWYRLLTAGEETPEVGYRAGVYARNLIPDLRQSLAEAETRHRGRVGQAWFMTCRIAELVRLLSGREVNDILVRDDLRPGVVELLDLGRAALRRAARRLPGAGARRRRGARVRIAAMQGAAARIVFICLGNICRSPFAAAALRARLDDPRIAVDSAGTMPQPGRPTPQCGIAAAAARGIDLTAHRSVWLSRELARSASVLIVFDGRTRDALLDRYPDLGGRLVMLGDLSGLGEIIDPIDGGPREFARVYDEIAAAIAELPPLLGVSTARRA